MILTIRTDKPEAELALWNNEGQLDESRWQAHRQLAETIHQQIEILLKKQNKNWNDISGLICFKGPGSFTGLRIGLTVGNTLAYSLKVPIVSESGENWQQRGVKRLLDGANETIIIPEYGQSARITKPKK